MWELATHRVDEEYTGYLTAQPVGEASGWFQPYADGPANNPVNPALYLIRQAAGGARRRLWMTSPYLILDQELLSDFCLAAKGGVDVRIMTPAVPDHWYVGLVNPHQLPDAGRGRGKNIRIYARLPPCQADAGG